MTRPPSDAAYRMGDGIVYVFDAERTPDNKFNLTPFAKGFFYFDYIGIGSEDYTIAMQESVKLEIRIRVLQCRQLTSLNIVKIDGLYYHIWKVKHADNKQGVPITDITLIATRQEGYVFT